MSKSPPTVILKPLCPASRLASLLEIRSESGESKDTIVVRVNLFEGALSVRGREHRVVRYESFTYSRGELVNFAFFDSEIWDTLTPQERHLVEVGHNAQQHRRRF
jgi:hypothetical protein